MAKAKAPLIDLTRFPTRLAAAHGLLVHAAIDLGLKASVESTLATAAGKSSKLARAFFDVAAARDVLGEILDAMNSDLGPKRSANPEAELIRFVAMQAVDNGRRDWFQMRNKNLQEQIDAISGRRKGEVDEEDDD